MSAPLPAPPTADGQTLSVGIDIGGSKVLAVVLDPANRVLGQARRPTQHGAPGVVDSVRATVFDALASSGAHAEQVCVVGVGVPGIVTPGSGVVRHAVNLGLGPVEVDLAALLSAELDAPVVVENDVNAAALGAATLLAAGGTWSGTGDLGLVSIGTGLAAGVVIGGQLHRGSRGAAGEIGHVPVDPHGLLCTCGQYGCLETIASGASLTAAWRARVGARADEETVWAALAADDAGADEVVATFASGVAAAVRLLLLTWDLERVVLAGGVTEVGEPLLAAVRKALQDSAAQSPFLAALDLTHRVDLAPRDASVAAVGAAVAARRALSPERVS